MIYLRKLFTQDLRDGKQIAFPKEPSLQFFNFDFSNGDPERRIKFRFNAEDSQYSQYDGKVIQTRLYPAGSEARIDGELKAFIRDFMGAKVEDILCFFQSGKDTYEFKFIQQGTTMYPLYLKLINSQNHTVVFNKNTEKEIFSNDTLQKIYYGAPGTGKSHEVKRQTGEWLNEDEDQDLPNVFRTTFHPDTDYASFVGCYKPTMKPTTNAAKTLSGKEEEIVYEYVPQVFADAYIYAYNNPTEPTYLVIEEINRGNCAQIFGDLFQLLDRKNGKSEYKIKADKDLAKYLCEATDKDGQDILKDKEGIKDGKLCLPANLHILATMNTSDQSLFPMDSAFKRRWEWEYVPINYAEDIKSGTFEIKIGDKTYSWVKFIEEVNKRIFKLTQSEDKQMGNFFIKHSVDEKEFKSKVMFYLWYEVLRDEVGNTNYFFYKKENADSKDVAQFTFKDLYDDHATETLQQFMTYLGVSPK